MPKRRLLWITDIYIVMQTGIKNTSRMRKGIFPERRAKMLVVCATGTGRDV